MMRNRQAVAASVILLALGLVGQAQAALEDFEAGAYIIDMGVEPQTFANGLKPYGLVHDLVFNHKIPVMWAINPGKAKDGADFTHDFVDYKGGPFIVQAEYATEAAPIIATWTAKGVVVVQTTTPMISIPIYDTLTSFPRTVLDEDNGDIVADYLVNAEIPSSFYRIDTPAGLNACDDHYSMPHADPAWSTHENLKTFNDDGALIWAACHAVSVLEQVDDPGDPDSDPDLNFLSATNGLIDFGDHDDGTLPYSYTGAGEPVMQFMGSLDAGTESGSEQIFLPQDTGWRLTTQTLVWDPDHPEVGGPPLSPGPAAVVALGRGFGNPSNGYVMYEGGHDHNKGSDPSSVAAQRAFLNFLLLAGVERRPEIEAVIPDLMEPLNPYDLSSFVVGGDGPYTFEWTNDCGGTFDNPYQQNPIFTPPATDVNLTCILRVTVDDTCVRRSFEAATASIPGKPDLVLTKSDSLDPAPTGGTLVYTLQIDNLGGDADAVTLVDTLPPEVTFVSSTPGAPTCNHVAGTVTCDLGTLAASASTSVTIDVTAPLTAADVTNSASVTHDDIDLNPTDNHDTEDTLIRPATDLELVSKTAVPATVPVGGRVTFTLTVRNNGPVDADDVEVSDPLPTGASFVSAGGEGWNCSHLPGPNEVRCVRATLATVATAPSIAIDADMATSGSFLNTATVSSEEVADTVPGNNSKSAPIDVEASADLSVLKVTDRSDARDGDNVNFTITVVNNGPDPATNVILSDTLIYSLDKDTDPPGFKDFQNFVPAQTTGPAPLNQGQPTVITWNLGTLNSGQSAEVSFRAKKVGDGTALNTAAVTSDVADLDPSNDSDTVSITRDIKEIDLGVLKNGPVSVDGSAAMIYTISVKNYGPENLDKGSSPDFNYARVVDTLPEGVTYTGFNPLLTATPIPPDTDVNIKEGTWSCTFDAPSREVTCDYVLDQGDNLDNDRNTYDVQILVNAPVTPGTITNSAAVSFSEPFRIDNTHSNNTSTLDTTVTAQVVDLEATKAVDDPTPSTMGQQVTFTVTVANDDAIYPNDATGVTVHDPLPGGLTLVDRVLSQGSYVGDDWIVGDLAYGTSATMTVDATVDTLAEVVNVATITGVDQNDQDAANDTDSASVDIPDADLEVLKAVDDDTPDLGQSVTFTITLTNQGPETATGVTLVDQIEPGLTIVDPGTDISADTGTPVWDGDAQRIDWDLGPAGLADQAVAVLTIVARVDATGTLSNTATKTTSDLPDEDADNDESTVTLEVQAADLTVTKTVDDESPPLAALIDFTVEVVNSGPRDATVVQVTDLLPDGLTYDSHSTAEGTYDDVTGLWDIGALANGATATLTITASVDELGTLVNTATITSNAPPDPNPNDNTDSATVLSGGEADIYLTKTVDDASPFVGQTVTFTVEATNYGPDAATGLVVNDLLPVGLNFVSASSTIGGAPGGSYNDGTGDWTIGDLAVDEVAELTLDATVTQLGSFTNTATVAAADQGDPDPIGNSASATVNTGPGADVSGFVWSDADHDGTRDGAETGIAGVTVVIYNVDTAECASAQTAADGSYTIAAVVPGAYRLIEAASESVPVPGACPALEQDPAGHVSTTPNTRLLTVTMINVVNQDFGDFNGAELTGRVFEDNGAGGGTAHDGLVQGGESGSASIAVRLEQGAATLDATTTDGDGRWTLWAAAGVGAVDVAADNPSGFVSVSKSDGGAGDTAAADAFDTITFTPAAGTVYGDLDFGDIRESAFAPDNARTALPGTVVFYPHVYTAYTEGDVSFTVAAAEASPPVPGWSAVIHDDADCSGTLDAGDDVHAAPVAVDADGTHQICIVVKVFVPGNAPYGANYRVEVQADLALSGTSIVLSRTRTDLTTAGDADGAGLELVKLVDKATALPGETLTYTLTYRNLSAESLASVVIHDATPAFATFVAASCILPLPGDLTDCQVTTEPAPGATGSIEWTLTGTLRSGAEGQLEYQVRVDD